MPILSLSMQSSITNKESAIKIFNPEKLKNKLQTPDSDLETYF